MNTVFGDQFWVNEPDRYPKGYYGFSSKVRFHIFMGQRLTYDIDPQRRFLAKSVTFSMRSVLVIFMWSVLLLTAICVLAIISACLSD